MAKSQLRIGVVLSYVDMAVGSLIPMFYTPIMLELLGQSEYGLFKLAGSVTSYLGLISFGIGSAVTRYMTKYRAEGDMQGEQGVMALFNIFFRIIASIALVAGIGIVFSINLIYGNSLTEPGQLDEMRILVAILSLTTAFNFLCVPYNAAVTSHERYLFVQVINILLTIGVPVANLIVLFMGFKSIGMALSSFTITLLVRFIYWLYVKKSIKLRPDYKHMPKHLIKEILTFSFWVFVAQMVTQLYNSTDTMIIGAIPMLATIGVAIYNIGMTFTSMMLSFSVGLLNVLTPRINMMVFGGSDNTELTNMMIRVGRLQCYIVSIVCSGFIVFGSEFIHLWAGEGYEDAYWVALATMIPACIPLVQNVAMNVIVAQNRHRFRSLTLLFIAIINVIGTLLAVNPFGIIGAAVVSGLAGVLGQGFILNWYYWKKIGLQIPRFWKDVGKLFIFPAVLAGIFLFIKQFVSFDNWPWLFAGIIIYSVIFILFNWFIVMNEYEKDILREPLRKLKYKLTKQGAK